MSSAADTGEAPYLTAYAVCRRLLGAVVEGESLVALAEIAESVIGADSFGYYLFTPDGDATPLVRRGGAASALSAASGRALVARCGALGAPMLRDLSADEPGAFAALVPLSSTLGARGVLVIESLLRHKAAFTSADREVMGILSDHALDCALPTPGRQAVPATEG